MIVRNLPTVWAGCEVADLGSSKTTTILHVNFQWLWVCC
jgi:hypothetical protein